MNGHREIYVRLLGEAVDVWRPVQAEHLHDSVYKILDQTYDRKLEAWQFEPGDRVICEMKKLSAGVVLAAMRPEE